MLSPAWFKWVAAGSPMGRTSQTSPGVPAGQAGRLGWQVTGTTSGTRIESATDNLTGSVTHYCYDATNGHLLDAQTLNSGGTQTADYSYTYDADGNIKTGQGSHTYNEANEITD
jgi:hypothetical protein